MATIYVTIQKKLSLKSATIRTPIPTIHPLVFFAQKARATPFHGTKHKQQGIVLTKFIKTGHDLLDPCPVFLCFVESYYAFWVILLRVGIPFPFAGIRPASAGIPLPFAGICLLSAGNLASRGYLPYTDNSILLTCKEYIFLLKALKFIPHIFNLLSLYRFLTLSINRI